MNDFQNIHLSEMDKVALLKRNDTKFILHLDDLNNVLNELVEEYRVLEINGKRIMQYESLYFDTAHLKFFKDHHKGKTNRLKIRQRKYVDSNLTFLEIKQKNGKGETKKSRIQISDFKERLNTTLKNFIKEKSKLDVDLKPSLKNNFHRITLVNLFDFERVTIDLGLSFNLDDKQKKYKNLVIVEVKQSKFKRSSTVIRALKKYHYNPYSVSKYCIGIMNLYDDIKYNLFKKKLLKVNKISA